MVLVQALSRKGHTEALGIFLESSAVKPSEVISFLEAQAPSHRCAYNAGREIRSDPRVLVVVEVATRRRFPSLSFSLGVVIVEIEKRLAIHESQIHRAAARD